jgi:hypothetical protein
MALAKTIETAFGVTATYWRIIRTNESFDGITEIYLAGYSDSVARHAGKAPLEIRTIQVETIDGKREDYYPILTESKTETRDTGEVDEEGNPVTEEVETNLFANAELA